MSGKNKCRCTEPFGPDGTCPHGCPPPGQQQRRRQAVGVKDRGEGVGVVMVVNRAATALLRKVSPEFRYASALQRQRARRPAWRKAR